MPTHLGRRNDDRFDRTILQIPIHHYFSINMDGMVDLVDAIGGITVYNDFEFTAEKIHYPEGSFN